MDYAKLSPEKKKEFNQKSYARQKIARNKRKTNLLNLIGGPKCSNCGYNKCIHALTFHHLNSNKKSFGLNVRGIYSRSLELVEDEAKKCIVLCANCHLELHYMS